MSRRQSLTPEGKPEAQVEVPAADLPFAGRLTLRLEDLVGAFGVSRRTIERERSAGRFPAPDLHIGKAPLWKPETIRRWIDGGGR
jgi:predicted DNA-binding transcriptional regulator AlpA